MSRGCRGHSTYLPTLLHCQIFWYSLNLNNISPNSDHSHWLDIIRYSNPSIPSINVTWSQLFPFSMWNLWINKNRNIENNTTINISIPFVIKQAIEYVLLTNRESSPSRKIHCNTGWHKPCTGWYKLNVDGAFKNNINGLGGVIRNSKGDWILGFHEKKHALTCTHTNILALKRL